MNDVWFDVDLAKTIETDLVEVNDVIANLPNLAGFGTSLLLSKSFKASKPLAALLPLDKIVLLPNSSEPSSILPLLFLSKCTQMFT
jgi:hypothetical protein